MVLHLRASVLNNQIGIPVPDCCHNQSCIKQAYFCILVVILVFTVPSVYIMSCLFYALSYFVFILVI